MAANNERKMHPHLQPRCVTFLDELSDMTESKQPMVQLKSSLLLLSEDVHGSNCGLHNN